MTPRIGLGGVWRLRSVTVIAAAAICLAQPAIGAWKYFTVREDTGTEFYVDDERIERIGSMRRIWELQNLKKPFKVAWSISLTVEMNCSTHQMRETHATSYSGPMASGSPLKFQSDENAPWHSLPQDTIAEQIFQLACQN